MAARGNAFALLEGDEEVVTLLALVSTAVVKAEVPPSAVDKSSGKNKKARASSLSSFQSSSAPQRSSDHEKAMEKLHGSERNYRDGGERQNGNSFKGYNRDVVERRNGNRFKGYNRDGVERQNNFRVNNRDGVESQNSFKGYNRDGIERQSRNGLLASNGQVNGSRQNNRGGFVSKRNNGCRNDEGPTVDGLKRHEGNSNGYQKKAEISNGHKKKKVVLTDDGWQVVARPNSLKHREGNVNGRELNNANGSETKVFEDKLHLEERGEKGVSDSPAQKLTDNAGEDEKEYKKRNGNGRANRGGYVRGEGKRENSAQGNENGKSSESIELLHEKEEQKYSGELNAGPEGDETAIKEAEKVVGKEEIERMERKEIERMERNVERELEAKRMTLKQYEKTLEEKRSFLESLKTEARKVALDKELESMRIIESKHEEINFVKLNSATYKFKNKLKKKAANNKDDNNAAKYIIVPPRRPRINNFNLGVRDDNRNGGQSEVVVNTSMSVKKAATPLPLSFKDAEQFPSLG